MRRKMGSRSTVATVLVLLFLASPSVRSRAAESLPSQLSDGDYWTMISDFSEPNGYFQYEIVTSNELSYQTILPELMKTARPGGTYLGVGPEQNFTYIAALQPKIAFIIDIRRDMMIEHLMYKSIFEMSADRVQFVANLFSRRAPAQLTADSDVDRIFREMAKVPADLALASERTNDILNRLKTVHHFPLQPADEQAIKTMYMKFAREGVLNFSSSFRSPGYATLMTMTDDAQKNWSFLATQENYNRVRSMHQKNLIVPLVGDFGGTKTLRSIGQYLKDHEAVVNVFYISNVEDYLQTKWPQFVSNIASMPSDQSSLFIRWSPAFQTSLDFIAKFLKQYR